MNKGERAGRVLLGLGLLAGALAVPWAPAWRWGALGLPGLYFLASAWAGRCAMRACAVRLKGGRP